MSKKISLKRKFGGLWARLAVFMAVILMTGMQVKAQVSYLAPVYVNPSDESQGISGWTTEQQDTYTSVSTSVTTWTDGWYVLDSDVTLSGYYTVNGDVKLILKNGCKLTVSSSTMNKSGIQISQYKKLTIYAQSADASVMGTIVATGGRYASGIGYSDSGGWSTDISGTLVINGGKITATGRSSSYTGAEDDYGGGAGIGGGRRSTLKKLVINGGVIVAQGANGGAGIGNGSADGSGYADNMPIIINGGNITATGGGNTLSVRTGGGAGIGCGGTACGKTAASDPCEIRINGGNITATGGEGGKGKGAGLGLGYTTPTELRPIYVSTNLLLLADNNNPPTTAIANTGENLYDALKGLQYAKAQPAVCKNTTTNKAYTSVQEAVNAAESDQTVQMIANSQENITIANGKTITLDLNGYVLKGTGSGSVVTVNSSSNFTIKDSGSTTTHYYTVGSDGLWTWIASPTNEQISGAKAYESLTARPAENAIIAVKGGAITGGTLTSGYGAGISSIGNLTLQGGNIVGNLAQKGAGVYLNASAATLTIEGGNICGNSSGDITDTNRDGAIFINSGNMTMSGGSVSFNLGYGGGALSAGTSTVTTITGGAFVGNLGGEGGAMHLRNTTNITDATIAYNIATANAGGFVFNTSGLNNSVVTISGNTQFTGNQSGSKGGAMDSYYGGIIVSGNTVISGNTAAVGGGGIAIQGDNSALTISGNVEISGNTASATEGGGGVYFKAGKNVTIGGSVTITGNTLTDGTTVSNVYLPTGKTITVSTEAPLASGANIGVTTATAPTVGNPVAFTSNGTANDIQYFTSDQAYGVIYKDSKLYLAMPVCQIVETGTKYYTSLQEGISAAANGQTVQMLANSQENITIAAGKTVTLDLNGYVLQGTGEVVESNRVVVMEVGAKLTLTDSKPDEVHNFKVDANGLWTLTSEAATKTYESLTARPVENDIIAVKGGVITGGYSGIFLNEYEDAQDTEGILTIVSGNIIGNNSSGDGAGVTAMPGRSVRVQGGLVAGNVCASSGGGVYVIDGELAMSGGSVSFNKADKWGGGVNTNWGSNSNFIMTGGIVTYNYAGKQGAGVGAYKNGSLTGGTITGNVMPSGGNGAGVYFGTDLTVGGTVDISGNTVNGAANNLYFNTGMNVGISNTTPLAEGANIGVTTATAPTDGNPVAVTSNGAITDLQYFKSDNSSYATIYKDSKVNLAVVGSNVCQIVETATMYSTVAAGISAATAGQTVQMLKNSQESLSISTTVTLDLNGHVLYVSSGRVINIGGSGNLTIMDSNPDAVHYYTVNSSWYWAWNDSNTANAVAFESLTARPAANTVIALKGGAITGGYGEASAIYSNGSSTKLYLKGGNIVGNRTADTSTVLWSAAVKSDFGTFDMSGGNIVGNSLLACGKGAGFDCRTCTFTMTGGCIGFNYAKETGAGIHLRGGGSVTMTGGSISYNDGGWAAGQGLNYEEGTLKVGGTAQIANNGNGTSQKNVNTRGNVITILTGDDAPQSSMKIGVYKDGVSANNPVAFTSNGTEDDVQYFTSDSSYDVIYKGDDKLYLAIPVCKVVETETNYYTLAEGLNAVTDGQTLLLMQDLSMGYIHLNKDITFNLGGHTLTGNDVINVDSGATVSLTNGTLYSNSEKSCCGAAGTGRLYVTNVTLNGYNALYSPDGDTYFGEGVVCTTSSLYSSNGSGRLHITDGRYDSSTLDCVTTVPSTSKLYISGGCFKYSSYSGYPLTNYLLSGYKTRTCTHEHSGYTDVYFDETQAVAKVRHYEGEYLIETMYASLADALTTAVNGDTIVLAKSTDESIAISGKDLTINFNGNTMTNSGTAITVNSGTLTLTDNTDNIGGMSGNIVANGGTTNLNNGKFSGTITKSGDETAVNINGGKYVNDPSQYVDLNHYVQSITESPYLYKVVDAACHDGSHSYLTVQDAIDAQTGAATITMANDTEENVTIGAGKDITIYLNGKDLSSTGSGNVLTVENGGKLTVNDTITTADKGTVTGGIALNGGTTNLNDGKFNGTVTKNDNATLAINGGKYVYDPSQYVDIYHVVKPIEETPYVYQVFDAVCNDGVNSYTTLQEAIDAQTTSATITLTDDTNEDVTIPDGKDITLDLNGHVLQGTGAGSVVTVGDNANFTLTDSNTGELTHNFKVDANGLWTLTEEAATKTYESLTARPVENDIIAVKGGAITGGTGTTSGYQNRGGAVYLGGATGSLTVSGGNIIGNEAQDAGGAIYSSRQNVNINGGIIAGNVASNYGCGGGVYTERSVLTMSGGSVSFNKSTLFGGGVFTGSNTGSNFVMTGGTVSYNYAELTGAGIYVNMAGSLTGGTITGNTMPNGGVAAGGVVYGNLTVGGTINISGNTVNDGETVTASNLYMANDHTFTIGEGASEPAQGMSVGIATQTAVQLGSPITVSSNGIATDTQYFTSDNALCDVFYKDNKLHVGIAICENATTGTRYYTSLQDGINAAQDGETLIMLSNITEDVTIADKTLTINLNGKEITGTDNAITVSTGGNLTINDGTENIGGVTGNIALNGGTTTINNGKYNGAITKDAAATLNLVGGKYSSDPTQFLTTAYAAKNIEETPYLYEVVGGDDVVCHDGSHGFTTVQNAVNFNYYQTKNATITMVKNSIVSATIWYGMTITLDLNGKVLQGTGTSCVLYVEPGGNLTVNDSDATAVHKFTPDDDGLWVLDETNGTNTVHGGVITGGIGVTLSDGNYGGGISNWGVLVLNGGNIVGNKATVSGGGVYTGRYTTQEDGSTFTMNGGCIYGNTAGYYGGGISVNSRCIVKLLGGEIRYNVGTYGGGVESGWDSNNPYTIGGDIVISDNTLPDKTTASNFYVYEDYTFTVGTGDEAPKTGMNVGVTVPNLTSGAIIPISTANGTTDYSKYFTADAGTPFIVFADKKDDMKLKITDEVKIILTADPFDVATVTLVNAETGATLDPEHVQYGTRVRIKAKVNSTEEGYAFKGWFNQDGTMFNGKYEYTFEATESHTLEARFTNEVIWVRIKK